MALAIDASSPAVATSSTATSTTASHTPPAGSLSLDLWSGNTHTAHNPATPTITDNLGAHLTYTLNDWQSRADSPNREGQAADWTAPVATSAAMTVSATSGVAAGDSEKHNALQVQVITGQHATPVGAHGKSGSASASTIAQSYTATATGSQGFIAVCDWTVAGTMTAGTGCTLIAQGSVAGQFNYGFFRRTTADGTSGGTTTLNVNIGGTSTDLEWTYVEIVPAGGGSTVNATATIAGAGSLTSAVVQQVTASLTGAGALTAPARLSSGTALVGVGALSSAVVQGSGGVPTGAGGLAVTAVQGVTAAMVGAGVLNAPAVQGVRATPAGVGALTAPAVQASGAVLAGSGALAAAATQGSGASLVGAGVLLAAGSVPGAGTAALSGAGALSASATQLAGVALVGLGVLTGAAAGQVSGVAALVGAGVLTINLNDCVITRPFAGVTSRPGSGSTTRPNTGITDDPC